MDDDYRQGDEGVEKEEEEWSLHHPKREVTQPDQLEHDARRNLDQRQAEDQHKSVAYRCSFLDRVLIGRNRPAALRTEFERGDRVA